jgi:glycine/D-amino acid oxidase-like deaminating enzyme
MRLRHPAFTPSAPPVTIQFDGQAIEAIPGESVAAALAAAEILTFRRTRSHEPRGLWCGMGACFECLVTIDGRSNQRACLAKVEADMVVQFQDEPVATAGTALAPAPDEKPAIHEVAVLIVGAGPAGLSAALEAARHLQPATSGRAIVILDERPQPGGQYLKPLGLSQRFAGSRFPDAQFHRGAQLVREVRGAGAMIINDANVWGAFPGNEIAALVNGRATIFKAQQLVLATGAYERPVPIPGATLPGVMTTGALQTLARAYRVAPGRRVIVAGNGPLNLQTAVELSAGGAEIVAVVEAARKPGWRDLANAWRLARSAPGLARDGLVMLAKLRRARVPVLWSHEVIAAEPRDGRFARARLRTGEGSERIVEADLLALGGSFAPSTELARMLGLKHRWSDRAPGALETIVDRDGRSSDPNVFVVGDGATIGGARIALARGSLAGLSAAQAIAPETTIHSRESFHRELERAGAFQNALWSLFAAPPRDVATIDDDAVICRCEELTAGRLRATIRDGHHAIGAVKRMTRAGMGRCQGRNCAAIIARMLHAMTGAPLDEHALFAPRAPAKPVPAGALGFEKPEWGGHKRVTPPPPIAARNIRQPGDRDARHRCDVLVIGGGVLGACSAYYLAREGIDVLVAERDDLNLQSSGSNAGSLHVQLLSFDFGAKAEAGGGPAAETLRLGEASVRLWREIENASGADLEIAITGGLMVAENERDLAFLRGKIALERRYGVEAELIDGRALRGIAPHLSEHLIGAELCPTEGKINPLVATYTVAGLARAAGARFLLGAEVETVARDGAHFLARTSAGTITAGRVVVAAGAWSPRLSAMLGIDLPVHGAPLQMIVTEPAPPLVDHLVMHADRHLSLKQVAAGGLVIGGGWTAGGDMNTGASFTLRDSIEGNLWIARRVVPALDGLHIVRSWAGMNVNIDGAPILGETPGMPGLFHAVTSNGYTLAPIVARLNADILRTGRTSHDITPFLLSRFV